MGLVSGSMRGLDTTVLTFYREDQRQLGYYDFMEKMSEEGQKYYKDSVISTQGVCWAVQS